MKVKRTIIIQSTNIPRAMCETLNPILIQQDKMAKNINSNTKKINASNQKQNLDNVLAPTAPVQFSRTTSDEEEKDEKKDHLKKMSSYLTRLLWSRKVDR